MRVIRSAGQNVSPSDDGRLYDQIFTDGLFEDATVTALGGNNIAISALYGVICGRDFTAEAQTINATLPEADTANGYIYVEIDTSSDDIITIGTALAPFTPTYENINTNGAVAQMVIATYEASAVAVTSVTPTYTKASAGGVGSLATIEASPVTSNYSVGSFLVYNGTLYKVTRAIAAGESLVVGTNIVSASVGAELTSLNNGLMNGYSGYMEWPTYTVGSGGWSSHVGGDGVGVKPSKSASSGYNLELDIPGYYLVFIVADFNDGANATGFRGLRMIVNEQTVQEDFFAPAQNNTTAQAMRMVRSTNNAHARVRMGLYQNSGSAVQVMGIKLYAIYMGNW